MISDQCEAKFISLLSIQERKIIFENNDVLSSFDSGLLPIIPISLKSIVESYRIRYGIDGSSVGIRWNPSDPGCGTTNGSIVLEYDRILQSDPIGSDSWVKLHPIVLIK